MKSLQRKDKAEDVVEDVVEGVVEDVVEDVAEDRAEDVDEAGVKLQEVPVEGQDANFSLKRILSRIKTTMRNK